MKVCLVFRHTTSTATSDDDERVRERETMSSIEYAAGKAATGNRNDDDDVHRTRIEQHGAQKKKQRPRSVDRA